MTVAEFAKALTAKADRDAAMSEIWATVRDCEELESLIDQSILAGRVESR